MNVSFIELAPFAKFREQYLDDEAYRALQQELLENPFAGEVIQGTGGLRKLRRPDGKGNRGKRGGLRIIYYCWLETQQILLTMLYSKADVTDLTIRQLNDLRVFIQSTIKDLYETQHVRRNS